MFASDAYRAIIWETQTIRLALKVAGHFVGAVFFSLFFWGPLMTSSASSPAFSQKQIITLLRSTQGLEPTTLKI